jgi:hypothetical protein
LWERVDEQTRKAHLRLVERYEQLQAKARKAVLDAEAAKATDEAALRKAVEQDKAIPAAKAPGLADAAVQAQRAAEAAGRMVVESASGLLDGLSDSDVRAAVKQAEQDARQAVDEVPAMVDELLAALARAAAAGGEAVWAGRLLEKRRATPFTPRSQPLTTRLAEAAQAAQLLRERVLAELEERRHRDTPVKHPPPAGFAPAPGTWGTGPAVGSQEPEPDE